MSKKIEVTKIVIRMGEQDAELTIEQARQLKDALNELLGSKETVYIPSQPVVIEQRYPYHPYPYWTVSYGTTTGGTSASVSYSLKQ